MLAKRLMVIALALPVGAGLIALGGVYFALAITLILGTAGWEYVRLFRMAGFEPSSLLVIGGAAVLVVSRYFWGFDGAEIQISALILLAMAYHLLAFERGRERAATDFSITLAGILYLGWLGAYMVSLRSIPEGKWWVLLVLPAVWAADAGAFIIGRRWGRLKMSPRLSPHKTWEGYAGGIVFGVIVGALIAALWGLVSPVMSPLRGALMGLVLAAVTPLGDLGESMIKRQVGAKDSSNLIPGHGGVLDRIDSWLWAGVIGYTMVNFLWL